MEFHITLEFLANVLFIAIAFFTFIKLLSSEVYLKTHRLLPIIAAIITLYEFYVNIIEFIPDDGAIALVNILSDMSALVTMFMMFYYLVLLKHPKFYKVIITVVVAIMILLCLVDFVSYWYTGKSVSMADFIALIVILLGSLYVFFCSKSQSFFDTQDRQTAAIMMFSFTITFVGFLVQAFFKENHWIISISFAIDCILFYELADSNRIEDTAALMSDTIFDLVEYPFCLISKDFYIIDTNAAGFSNFPYGKGIEFAFEDGDYKKKFILAQHMIENNENDKEYFAADKWYRLNWTVVESKRGIHGYILTATDVTEQHKLIQAAKEETAEKSQFLAHMSHELRSPLHAIIGVSDILLSKNDVSLKNKNLIQHIKKASDGLLDLVDAILDFSKLEAGKFSFTEKKYNIDELLEDVAYANIVNLQSKPVDFMLTVTSEYPKYLLGDATRVREIFQNIVGNAVKFTERGSIRADIAFEVTEDIVHISFEVSDTGPGMTPDQIAEIFDEYVTSADGSSLEGTGLGLSITKQLIALLGGSITAKSDGISGSTLVGDFYQRLGGDEYLSERSYNRRTVLQQSQAITLSNTKPEWVYPQAKVLVADDMKINQEILTQILAPWQCKVTCVSDGLEAVEAMRAEDYQIIFLDQMMAPCSGPEAASKIREFSDVPIVLVTANSEDNVRNILIENRINAFLGKPINGSEIHAIIDQYMPAEFRQKDLYESIGVAPHRDIRSLVAYQKTLETFVKEMQPLILNLPKYETEDRDMFKIKVHGIKGVSRQIGRETFADQAEIMEMAAKAEHWTYVEKHLDEFLNALVEVTEDVTKELTQITPEIERIDGEPEKEKVAPTSPTMVRDIFKNLLNAFESYDIAQIEYGINALSTVTLNQNESKVYSKVIDAYEELEYEQGSDILSEYLESEN